jgi:hypothetical protein
MARTPASPSQSSRLKAHWQLPDVLGVRARHVRYAEPKLRHIGTQLTELREAVEFLVRTSGEFPARALSPALYVGDKELVNYRMVGMNQYLFFAFDPQGLQQGAPISIGWPNLPGTKIRTKFRFEVERPGTNFLS